jgi:hypothetical protein
MPNESAHIRLLVWDDPDVKASLASVLVSPPQTEPDVDLEAVFLWLSERCQEGEEAEACLFTAIEPGQEAQAAQHVTDIRNQGFAVVVRPAPRTSGGSGAPSTSGASLSSSVQTYVDKAIAEGDVTELLVASHDAHGLRTYLDQVAGRGTSVTVLGFRERAQYAAESSVVGFVDLETVEGVFAIPLPRTNLYELPEEGLALAPLRKPSRDPSRAVGSPSSERPAPPPAPESSGLSPSWASPSTADVVYPHPAFSPISSGSDYTPTSTPVDYASAEATTSYGAEDVETTPDGASENEDRGGINSEPPPSPLTTGLFGTPLTPPSDEDGATIELPPPPPPPPSVGALDDLLAGVQASPLTPPPDAPELPPRTGRVSPPNSLGDDQH